MVSLRSQLIEAEPLEIPTIVVLRDGQSLEATHWAQATKNPNVRLTDVLNVSRLKENVFLISMASKVNGAKIIMENGLYQVMKNKKVALSAKKTGRDDLGNGRIGPKGEENVLVDYH